MVKIQLETKQTENEKDIIKSFDYIINKYSFIHRYLPKIQLIPGTELFGIFIDILDLEDLNEFIENLNKNNVFEINIYKSQYVSDLLIITILDGEEYDE